MNGVEQAGKEPQRLVDTVNTPYDVGQDVQLPMTIHRYGSLAESGAAGILCSRDGWQQYRHRVRRSDQGKLAHNDQRPCLLPIVHIFAPRPTEEGVIDTFRKKRIYNTKNILGQVSIQFNYLVGRLLSTKLVLRIAPKTHIL
eukprot:2874081-Amphidinium_carterae.1